MRNMSFSMTTEAVRNRSKTVTRRLGWWNLKAGTILQAVEKAQGLRKGEHVKPICLIRVVSVAREPVGDICNDPLRSFSRPETIAEGFPNLNCCDFVEMFCDANGCEPETEVNRIEFEYVEAAT